MGTPCKSSEKRFGRLASLTILLFLLSYAKEPCALALAITVHEAAHLLTALLFTRELPRLSVRFAGLSLHYTGLSKCAEQIAVSAAGPLANIICAITFNGESLFSLYSLGLAIINLLPASCLDGGGILRAICQKLFDSGTSFLICRTLSVITVLIVFAFNCAIQLKMGTNISFALISVFLTVEVLGKKL